MLQRGAVLELFSDMESSEGLRIPGQDTVRGRETGAPQQAESVRARSSVSFMAIGLHIISGARISHMENGEKQA